MVKRAEISYPFSSRTYCTVKVENTWRTQWQGKLFSSHGTNQSCGVMVLVRSDLDFNLKSVEGDLISEDNKLVTNKLQELNVSPLDADSDLHV